MTDDPSKLTLHHVQLLITGRIFVPYPSGSFDIRPDVPVDLFATLSDALEKHGLEEHFAAIAVSMREAVWPHFKSQVDEMEQMRQKILADEPDL